MWYCPPRKVETTANGLRPSHFPKKNFSDNAPIYLTSHCESKSWVLDYTTTNKESKAYNSTLAFQRG